MDLEEELRGVDVGELLGHYDEAARQLLQVALSDGHFADWDPAGVEWPASSSLDRAGLELRARLIGAIHEGIPPRREARLAEAHGRYMQAMPAYHQASALYLELRRQFIAEGQGEARDFLQLYQVVYLQALGREDPFELDAGEAALVQLRVARVPLSHAHSVAEKLQAPPAEDDPRWERPYTLSLDGQPQRDTLRQHLAFIAERVVDFLATGEHLAIRYNTFNNFVWLGISIWKAITDAELLLDLLRGRVRTRWGKQLDLLVLAGKGMLLKFLQAHLEDPAQIKPREYWYGQEYSYLTRDMIDLTRALVHHANRLATTARGEKPAPVPVPPLLAGRVQGRFLEYPRVGRQQALSSWKRRWRLLRWAWLFRRIGKRKTRLRDPRLDPQTRLRQAGHQNGEWARRTLEIFDIQVDVLVDPHFAPLARALDLSPPHCRLLFLPTHQSVLDHPVMNWVLRSPAFVQALGWEEPLSCAMLARARLTEPAVVKVGPWRFSLIGLTPEEVDHLLEEVDGHIIMQRSGDTSNPTRRFAKLLDERPGVIYGAGTTSAFELQCLPMQHALFAHLPPDVIIVPIIFRGIHSLWPKCPRGNLHINPGRVEVVVCPPMLGETTLLPRKRALRTQLEPATLFQAVHIANLLNPEPTTAGAP